MTTSIAAQRPERERRGAVDRHFAGIRLAAERTHEFEFTASGLVRAPRKEHGYCAVDPKTLSGTCPDSAFGGNVCYHARAVEHLTRCHEATRGMPERRFRFEHLLSLSVDAFRPVVVGESPARALDFLYEVRSIPWTPEWLREAARLRWRAVGEAWSRGRGRVA